MVKILTSIASIFLSLLASTALAGVTDHPSEGVEHEKAQPLGPGPVIGLVQAQAQHQMQVETFQPGLRGLLAGPRLHRDMNVDSDNVWHETWWSELIWDGI